LYRYIKEQMVNIVWDFLTTTFCKAAKKVLPNYECETTMPVRTLDDVGVGVKMVMTVKKIPSLGSSASSAAAALTRGDDACKAALVKMSSVASCGDEVVNGNFDGGRHAISADCAVAASAVHRKCRTNADVMSKMAAFPAEAMYDGMTASHTGSRLAGFIHDDVCEMRSAFHDLSHNALLGSIPTCVTSGQRGLSVLLESNGFSGALPAVGRAVRTVNVAHNHLSGDVSAALKDAHSLRMLAVEGNRDLSGRVEEIIAATPSLRTLDVSETAITAVGAGSSASALALSSLSSYALGGSLFVPVAATTAASDAARARAVHVVVHVGSESGAASMCGSCPVAVGDGDCSKMSCARQKAIDAVGCAVRALAAAHSTNAAPAAARSEESMFAARVDRVSKLPDGGAVVALTLTAVDHTLSADGAAQLATSLSSPASQSAVKLDYSACGLGDGTYSALGTSEKKAADFHVRLLSKHPAVISAARVGCSGAGRMGTHCDYQCPTRWMRTGGTDMHAIHASRRASSSRGTRPGAPPSLGGRSVDVPVARHAGNVRLDTNVRASTAAAKFIPAEQEERRQSARGHGPPTELEVHHKEVHRLRTYHVFTGPASERHTASGSLQGCHASCRYSVKLAAHECGKWAEKKSDEDALAKCRAAIDEEVPKYCSVTRASCKAAHGEAVKLGQPPIYTTTATRKSEDYKVGLVKG
jgi:hypothetical protein